MQQGPRRHNKMERNETGPRPNPGVTGAGLEGRLGRRGGAGSRGDSPGISKGTRGPAPDLMRPRELDRLSKPN